MRALSTGAVAAAVALACAAAVATAPALAHEGNPNYRSTVRVVVPRVPGVSFEVIDFDDHLLLRSTGGHRVEVTDYDGRPYARIEPDRTVLVNTNSEAYYLNQDRFSGVDVPAGVGSGPPRWRTLSRSGRFEWHDHRIHWMSHDDPPQLTDKGERTHIFDWTVPIRVDGRAGKLYGDLYWQPPPSSGMPLVAPLAVVVGGAGIAAGVVLLRRRRPRRRRPAQAW